MKLVKNTLMLNLGLLTSSFALDSFPPDIFQHICPKLSAVDRTHLDMSGSKTLKVKTDQAIDDLIKKRLQDIQMDWIKAQMLSIFKHYTTRFLSINLHH